MSKFGSVEELCEAAGYDAGKNGADTENCHFSLFAKPEYTKAWERGKARADAEKRLKGGQEK